MSDAAASPLKVVILGGGFAGLEAARGLADAPVEVTVVDRENHHCFQPLLYQVATASLTPADVAWPLRGVLGGNRNTRVVLAEVEGVDAEARKVRTTGGDFAYDVLVVATGAGHAYFGNDGWARHAPGLKRLDDAEAIRRRILMAFETAELAGDAARRAALTTFVVVGGGPTGVEMAGAIADMARHALPSDFRNIDPCQARVVLVEAGQRILPAFPDRLGAYAQRALERMGVEVRTGVAVSGVDDGGVDLGETRLDAGAVVWAAGVEASPAARWLDAPADKAGRVKVNDRLEAPGHPEILVLGDTAAVEGAGGRPVPGIAPAAKQMGAYAARRIARQAQGRPPPGPFRYRHQGDLATIGRSSAIVKLEAFTLTGLSGWLFWGAAHVYFLIGPRNRIAVTFHWLWEYLTRAKRARLITGPERPEGPPAASA